MNDSRFLIDDQGRTKKILKPLEVCPTLRREMHGNEPKVVEPIGAVFHNVTKIITKEDEILTNKTNFKYVSLFSGVGGFETALNRLGGECVLASEIDKYANIAYETLYGHKTVGDIMDVNEHDVPDHDLLVGGFPCQAFSVAGKRLGFADTRGTLFFEIARIADAKKPKALLLENVKGLVGHDKGKTLDTIVHTLNDIGYTVDFEVLNSKYFGVPQNRERIFIVAVRDDLINAEPWVIGKRTDVVAKGKRRISGYGGVKTFNFDYPKNNEVTTRLRDILENAVDERFYLSEDKTEKLVAQLEDKAEGVAVREATKRGYAIAEEGDSVNVQFPESKTRRGRVGKQMANTLQAGEVNQGVVVTDGEPNMVGHIDIKGHDALKRVYAIDGVSPTLTTMGGGNTEPKIAEEQNGIVLKKQATEIVRGSDLSHFLMARDYKGFGNQEMTGVIEETRPVLTPDRVEKRQNGRRFKDDGEESFTLTAQDRHGVALGNPPKYRIRKLTPRECFRLQAFSDEQFDKLVEVGISNSQLYKLSGNAVTVNVVEAVSRRLLTLITNEEAQNGEN